MTIEPEQNDPIYPSPTFRHRARRPVESDRSTQRWRIVHDRLVRRYFLHDVVHHLHDVSP